MQAQRLTLPKGKSIHIIICLLIMALFWVLPAPAPLTQVGMRVIGVFAGTVLLFSLVDTFWPALLAVLLLSRTGVASLNDVIAGSLGNWGVYFILMSLIMCAALNRVGFLDRLVSKFMGIKFVTRGPWIFTFSMAAVGMILGSFIDQIPATAFILAFANRVYKELGYTYKDPYPHVANIVCVFATVIGGAMTPISHALTILGLSLFEGVAGQQISLFSYLAFGVPTGLLCFVALIVVTLILTKVMKIDTSNFDNFDVTKVLGQQNKMDLREKITVALFFGTVLVWILPGIGAVVTPGAAWVAAIDSFGITFWAILCALILGVLHINGTPVIELKEIIKEDVNWSLLIFISVCVYFGSALANPATGLNEWITQNLTPLTASVAPMVVIFIITAGSEIMTNFAANSATILVMTTIATTLAMSSGGSLNPAGMAMCVTMAASLAYLLPSSFGCIAMLHGDKWSDSKKVYLFGIIMMAVTCVIVSFVGYPISCILAK